MYFNIISKTKLFNVNNKTNFYRLWVDSPFKFTRHITYLFLIIKSEIFNEWWVIK